MMKKLLLIPFLFIAFASFAQTKLTIQTTGEQSCAVDKKMSSVSGTGEAFRVIAQSGDVLRSLIQFDLSSIPQGSKVNWAKLSLFCEIGDGGQLGHNSSKLRRVTSAWTPGIVTWKTQPTTTNRGEVRLANSTNQQEDYKNIDVWTLVHAMVDSPTASFGLELRLDTENGLRAMEFYSPAQGMPHLNPKLVIEYTPPGFQKQQVVTLSEDLSGISTQMNVYPNPCSDIFNCNIKSNSADISSLRVMDILGRTVYSQPVNTSNLQLRVNLPSSSLGTYFIVLQDSKGATIVSQQLQVN